MKNFKYTFDFDGKMIPTKNVNSEKLPPSQQTVNYIFTQSEIEKKKAVAKIVQAQLIDHND